ncbi:MAG TPA: phytanoyl-CoA dioxygenase family protein [Lysobacter sp.]|nr:phytanoyl-CoA dioxygenase family protein [Lysobacter sp.]
MGIFSDSLSVEWSQYERAAGVLRALFSLPEAGVPASVRVSVDGTEVLKAPAVPKDDGRVRVNVHTHLLDDGAHKIDLRLTQGRREWTAVARVETRNDGGVGPQVRAALRAHGVPLAFVGDCDASHYAAAQVSVTAWVDAPDAEERISAKLAAGAITASEAEMLRRFVRDGFVILDELLPEPMVERANAALDEAIAQGYQGYRFGDSTRLEQMHVHFPAVRDIWLYPPVHRFLSLVFGAPSRPCQSLVYVFGSQQDAHQDTIHLTPFPAGLMCGVWIALEDVQPGSGELVVHPGSHRLPRVYMHEAGCAKVSGDWSEFGAKVVGRWAQMLRESGITPMPYLAKRGQILIWHENLMHAGSIRSDPSLSRRSIVTHHFAEGVIAYYDSSGDVGYVYPEPVPLAG